MARALIKSRWLSFFFLKQCHHYVCICSIRNGVLLGQWYFFQALSLFCNIPVIMFMKFHPTLLYSKKPLFIFWVYSPYTFSVSYQEKDGTRAGFWLEIPEAIGCGC